MKILTRLLVGGVGAVTAGVLAAGPALAHECFNTQWSDQAASMIGSHSHGWFDIQTSQFIALGASPACDFECPPPAPGTEALAGVDPETLVGVILGFVPPEQALGSDDAVAAFENLVAFSKQVAAAAEELGVPTDYLTSANATLAGGAERSGRNITSDGRGIDHFPDVYMDQIMTAYLGVYCGEVPDAMVCSE